MPKAFKITQCGDIDLVSGGEKRRVIPEGKKYIYLFYLTSWELLAYQFPGEEKWSWCNGLELYLVKFEDMEILLEKEKHRLNKILGRADWVTSRPARSSEAEPVCPASEMG